MVELFLGSALSKFVRLLGSHKILAALYYPRRTRQTDACEFQCSKPLRGLEQRRHEEAPDTAAEAVVVVEEQPEIAVLTGQRPTRRDGIGVDVHHVVASRVAPHLIGAQTVSSATFESPRLSIVCEPCGRRGTCSVARLMERHGDAKLTDLLRTLACREPLGGLDEHDVGGAPEALEFPVEGDAADAVDAADASAPNKAEHEFWAADEDEGLSDHSATSASRAAKPHCVFNERVVPK